MTRKKQKFSKPHAIEIDQDLNSDSSCLLDILPDCQKSPLDIIIDQETKQNLDDIIYQILNTDILSQRQAECIKLYFLEGMTFAQIGKKFNITREAVRQNIKKAITKIKALSTYE